MSARRTFRVASETFTTQKALIERIRRIMYAYPDHGVLTAADQQFMTELLGNHPDAKQKIGAGVAKMWVQTNPVYTNTRNFWLQRVDGSATDFSFMECLVETTHLQRFHRACRAAIAPDIKAFKLWFFTKNSQYRCPFTGESLSLRYSHVDHVVPFALLVARFIQESAIHVATVAIAGKAEDNTCLDRFVDDDLESAWRAFHDRHAELRVVSPTANLSLLRKSSRHALGPFESVGAAQRRWEGE